MLNEMLRRDGSSLGVSVEVGVSSSRVHPCPMKSPVSLTKDRKLPPTAARCATETICRSTCMELDRGAPVRFPNARYVNDPLPVPDGVKLPRPIPGDEL